MKKKLLIILLIPLLVLLTACKKEETKETEEKKEETVTFTDSELQKYVDYINPISIGPSEKLYNISSVEAVNLTTAEKLNYIGKTLYEKEKHSEDAQYSILAESDVKEIIEKIYGPNTYEQTKFSLGCGQYELRDDNNYYAQTGCGGATATSVKNEIIEYKATKTKLEITTAYVMVDAAEGKIYKDYDKTTVLDDYSENQDMKEYINNNKDKLSHIVYTFESKDGNNYYFAELKNTK